MDAVRRTLTDASPFDKHAGLEMVGDPPSSETSAADCSARDLRIAAADGFSLAATLHAAADRAAGVVVVNSATGVRRAFYRRFAAHLAAHGLDVLTYDYRGIGESRPRSLRGFSAAMHHWGERDLTGVLAWAHAHAAGRRIVAVGHSAGGQIVGLAPNRRFVSALLAVGAQSGDWRLWPAPARYRMALLWYGVVPAVANAFGYLPGAFGIGEDLPRGVALEWAHWCRTPAYLAGDDGARRRAFAAFDGHILAMSFDDDDYAPSRAVDGLMELYASARVTRRHVRPADVGMPVGHFGFFREAMRERLWRDATAWLVDRVSERDRDVAA